MKNIITSTWDDVRFQPQQKPKTSAPLSLQTKPYFFYSCCICSKISLTSATTMTQPQMWAHFCSIRSHHTWTRIRSDLLTQPTVATSSLKRTLFQPQSWISLEDKSDVPTAKEISDPLPGVCERMEERALMVKQKWGEQSVHQSCSSNVLKGFLTHFYSHTQTVQLGQQRKSRPHGPVIYSASLVLKRSVLKSPDLKPWKFKSQIPA